MNNYDMEANSREEILTSFKSSYGRSMENFRAIIGKFCPDMNGEQIQNAVRVFYPFMFGIYPYTAVTEKQKRAMRAANVDFTEQTVYELTLAFLTNLLGE